MFGFPVRGGLYAQYLRKSKRGKKNDIRIHGNVEISADLHTKICELCAGMWPDRAQNPWDIQMLSDMNKRRLEVLELFLNSPRSVVPALGRALTQPSRLP